jgi:DHA1 family bicyclomycin/chloramphenicol resistance-like MFS transporter
MSAAARLGRGEFVGIMVTLFATIALSIDAMLPALPRIAADLSPEHPNLAQMVVTAFVFGLGLGTLVMGPLSDAFGRKRVILGGLMLYGVAALACAFATSLEALLLLRFVQGLGVAAPRVVGSAMMRDAFKGREMAQVMSIIMAVFMGVPAAAPLLGQAIMALADWRAIFWVFAAIAVLASLWLGLRQPETLPLGQRRPLSAKSLWEGAREVASMRIVAITTLLQGLIMAGLFATLSSLQGIFDQTYGRAGSFPLWFAMIALVAALGSVINARLVTTWGMRAMITLALRVLLGATLLLLALHLALPLAPDLAFAGLILWAMLLFGTNAMSMGNLNALALEPLGHLAGTASSLITALATVLSVALAVPVGLAFAGTEMPLLIGISLFGLMAQVLMRALPAR